MPNSGPEFLNTNDAGRTTALEVKAFRKSRGWTQAQLAERFHVPKRTVEDWEARDQAPAYLRRAFLMEEMVEHWKRMKDDLVVSLAHLDGGQKTHTNGVDDTPETIARTRSNIDELDQLIERFGI